ncbi:hypothetical protein B0T10DRAFT_473908 [Thelonectria olida]|uniref:Uncharacterized protein n=1 Tax=Thelonectria olida TaxID=1576542 RepID=A0A9P9AW47_9HYPO|nr:hypothetical protein B0T10DRAFT_473908 [Thelonectria olida]
MTFVLEYGMATLYHGTGCAEATGALMHPYIKDFGGCDNMCNPADSHLSAYLQRWPHVQIRGYADGDCTGTEVWYDYEKYEPQTGMCLDWGEPVKSYHIWSPKACKKNLHNQDFGLGPTEVWTKNWTGTANKKEEFLAELDGKMEAKHKANEATNEEESDQPADIEGNADEAADRLYEETKEKTWVYPDRKWDNRWSSKPRSKSRPYG